MTGPAPMIVDLYHGDTTPGSPVDMHALAAAGVIGAILKAGQGTNADPMYTDYYQRAITLWDPDCVHSYWFLDGTDANDQMTAFMNVTQGLPGRWLDYEQYSSSQCTLDNARLCCQLLNEAQGAWPGMYGSDLDLLGAAIDAGHFGPCPIWIASYTNRPEHACQLWQFAEGVEGDPVIGGKGYDLSTFPGGDSDACAAFMQGILQAATA